MASQLFIEASNPCEDSSRLVCLVCKVFSKDAHKGYFNKESYDIAINHLLSLRFTLCFTWRDTSMATLYI